MPFNSNSTKVKEISNIITPCYLHINYDPITWMKIRFWEMKLAHETNIIILSMPIMCF